MTTREPNPVYIVVRRDLSPAEAALAIAHATQDMESDAACGWSNHDEPAYAAVVDDEAALRAIIAEGALREDWVSIAAEGEDREEARAAVIGPTSGAGPLLLKAAEAQP